MAIGASRCDLCQSEGFEPRPLTAGDHSMEWDGQRHSSLRLHRPADVPRERYEAFLRVVLGPIASTKPAAAVEAA